MESLPFINIKLDHLEKDLQLTIDARLDNTLFFADDAEKNGEAPYQLVEGYTYDYELNKEDFTLAKDQIVLPHPRKKQRGTISPNIFVGTITLLILHNDKEVGKYLLEVKSVKAEYRKEYHDMLEFITEKCTDLLMQANSPATHNFETDFNKDNETLYQKFAFIKSIISTDEFSEAVHRIVSSPVTQWKETEEFKDIRNIRHFKNSNVKELITASNRTYLPENHFLREYGLTSLPVKISSVRKTDTVDTPENRFVKFALENFMRFCAEINKRASKDSRLWQESGLLERKMESFLHHPVFKEISHPETLRLNSPVLQRKEGYREILRVWLMFDLAAKLIWKGGDDVYCGGKKDIATLYEYWLFFKLLELFKSIFNIEHKAISELIKETADGLSLQLKQGHHTALAGVYTTASRKLNVRFNYNRSFSGSNDYPHSGSWTTTMRPDYTLSFWPFGISEKEAEIEELIVHIHFDAKYKIANLINLINKVENQDKITELGLISKIDLKDFSWEYISELLVNSGYARNKNKDTISLLCYFWEIEDVNSIGEISGKNFTELIEIIQQTLLSEEKEENRKGIYKNADLLKMHAYKDAIRRTGGAYVLYPGDTSVKKKGFHEIIPGLGAFPVRPSKTDDGINELKVFILDVLNHFINRASQREKMAYRAYDIYKNKPLKEDEVYAAMPETFGVNRNLLPDDTFVLVGFYKDQRHLDWILKEGLYNTRADSDRGSLRLGPDEAGAKYLLLHSTGETKTSRLFKITESGPRVFSKQTLNDKDYPSEPTRDYYLVFNISEINDKELMHQEWDISKLDKYKPGYASALPFSVSLTELMRVKVR
ncbi:MAG: DUF2357 domain-containing protein [Bacteroidetes bacterium]|nr:DUF2357 domain-containing protein [Bacteroidota bacterium]